MRRIGILQNPEHAKKFSDYLLSIGIDNKLDSDDKLYDWEIWVLDEDELLNAKDELQSFLLSPDAEKYTQAEKQADEIREQIISELKEHQKKQIKANQIIQNKIAGSSQSLTLTNIFILISIFVFLFSEFGKSTKYTHFLFITEYFRENNYAFWSNKLPEIFSGQIWRLITPIFLHFNFLHIFFNMWWLKDLGNIIEYKQGKKFFAFLLLSIALASNLSQFFMSGPMFGGMSGVIYGLFGYIWIRGKFDPSSGYYIDQSTVYILIGWLFLCMTGLLGPIANTAHVAGLLAGMAFGFIFSGKIKLSK